VRNPLPPYLASVISPNPAPLQTLAQEDKSGQQH
jgi:hypothetical protein